MRIIRSAQIRISAVSRAAEARSAAWQEDRSDCIADHEGEQGSSCGSRLEILKKCATIQTTPHAGQRRHDGEVGRQKSWRSPQLATCDGDCRAATTTLLSVLLLRDARSGFQCELGEREIGQKPMQAINRKQARQPKPDTAAASRVSWQ